jgi:hypothetical protein
MSRAFIDAMLFQEKWFSDTREVCFGRGCGRGSGDGFRERFYCCAAEGLSSVGSGLGGSVVYFYTQ